MINVAINERTQALLNDPLLGERDVDAKIQQLIESEYLHQSARYRRVDLALTQKYSMDFDAFVSQRVVKERGYSWDVEQDAMDWETAIGGMQTLERKLRELRNANID